MKIGHQKYQKINKKMCILHDTNARKKRKKDIKAIFKKNTLKIKISKYSPAHNQPDTNYYTLC